MKSGCSDARWKAFCDNKVEKLDSGKVEKEIDWNKKTALNASTDFAASKIRKIKYVYISIFCIKMYLSIFFKMYMCLFHVVTSIK